MRPWLPICIVDWKWTWWGTLLSGVGVGVGGGVFAGDRFPADSPGKHGGFGQRARRRSGRRIFAGQIPGGFCPLPADFPANMAGSGSAPGSAAGGGFSSGGFPADFARSGGFPANTADRAARPAAQRAEGFRRGQIPGRILPVPGGFSPGKHGGVRAAHPAAQRAEGFAGITGTARQQATHPRSTDPKSRQKPIYTAVSAARGTKSIRATSGGLPIRGQDRMHKPRDTISRCPVRS